MLVLQKWNYEKHKYERFESPAKRIALVIDDPDMITDCTNCGRTEIVGETYTSQQIHDSVGIGFPVCDICYQAERVARAKAREADK